MPQEVWYEKSFSGPLYHNILKLLWNYVYTVSYQELGRRFPDLWLLHYMYQDQMRSYMLLFIRIPMYKGPSQEGLKYILLLRDDFSSYVWCFAFESADAESAAGALKSWFAAFSSMPWLVTDQGSHFKNQILVELKKTFRYSHHFTTPYSLWYIDRGLYGYYGYSRINVGHVWALEHCVATGILATTDYTCTTPD